MKICITGGGTGGHVTPLLAVASELKKQSPDADITYIGTRSDVTSKMVSVNQDIDSRHKILAGKLRRYHGKTLLWYFGQPKIILFNIRDFFYTIIGLFQSIALLMLHRPAVLFVKGGYVGLPVGLAATLLRIPIVTHDSDTYPGLTNRILSRYAKTLAVGAPVQAYPQYAGKNVVYTGVPIRDSFYNAPEPALARERLGLPKKCRVVAVLGGSLGAVRLNESVVTLIEPFLSLYDDVYLLWVTGAGHHAEVVEKVNNTTVKNRIKLWDFTHELEIILAASDIIITRAGATAIAEAALFAKPTIIVPNDLLTGGHQLKNAKVLDKSHAAVVISDKEIQRSPEILQEQLVSLLENSDKAKDLASNIATFSKPEASSAIASLIVDIGSN